MREEGKSYRQIAEELGYKSATTVLNLLSKE
jgi:DNA-binding CsgD family transcriptional regulator